MKKLITLKVFFILFIFSGSTTAQIEFGIKGGLNFNYANNETYLIEGWKKCSICTLESQYFNIFDINSKHAKKLKINIPKKREINKERCITITNASGNNLKNVTANFPLSTLTCVTGVSGSGKSTLLLHTLFAALNRKLNNSQKTPMEYDQSMEYII